MFGPNQVSVMTLLFKLLLRFSLLVAVALLTVPLASVAVPGDTPGFGALADEDDDDDDDDDGDDSNGGSRGGGGGSPSGGGSARERSGGGEIFRFFKKKRSAPRRSNRRPRTTQTALPANVPNEILALGLTDSQVSDLLGQGYEVLQAVRVELFDSEVLKLRVPSGIGLEQARAAVSGLNPQAVVDFNHYYRPETAEENASSEQVSCQGNHCAAWRMVNWPVDHAALKTCSEGLRIGLIDTGINEDHAALSHASLEVIPLEGDKRRPSSRQHGTAVAVILAGNPSSRSPGLLPGAELFAVDAFHRGRGKDDRGDAYSILQALDHLSQKSVHVLNMSLAGPENALLQRIVEQLSEQSIVLVAAVGNGGKTSKNMYPAAYPSVIAVTAIDGRERVYRRAVQGDHVDFAAPGVNVWTAASIRGARPKTGTSFAAPFVTAAVAVAMKQLETADADRLRETLAGKSKDLGKAGKDPVFGHGLVQGGGGC